MTHSDIYTKFMIEYDKDNITSSYPSLTRYEIATTLDKAYLALIAQKFTGNNPRGVRFEGDTKAIEDLSPLVKSEELVSFTMSSTATNEYVYSRPNDMLYYIIGSLKVNNSNTSTDGNNNVSDIVTLVSHDVANNFKATNTNLPWVKNSVAYLEGDSIKVLVDPIQNKSNKGLMDFTVTYISKPNMFVTGPGRSQNDYDFGDTKFELSDSMAEELINLAILMSAEVVESSRLTTKSNTKQLES